MYAFVLESFNLFLCPVVPFILGAVVVSGGLRADEAIGHRKAAVRGKDRGDGGRLQKQRESEG
uniref:Phd finger transcription factor n=1 Tax=Rhizophora mucronata TaxID=61149 RepID=A0A2P2IKT8_RHIMU